MKVKFLLSILLFGLISCEKEAPTIVQHILFEKHHTNYALGYQNNGYLIDSMGNVRTFNLSKDTIKWNETDKDGYISVAKMNENLAHCKTISGFIQQDTLNYYSNKIWDASYGKITEPVNLIADAGITTYSAFVFEKKSNRYQKIIIKTCGDWMIDNSAPESESIYQWMQKINTSDIENSDIIQLNYGTSFGECLGYCKREMTLKSGLITYNCSSWNSSIQPINRNYELNNINWNNVKLNLNTTDFFALPAIIGCPDCADGGGEWMEIVLLNGSKHKVTFEYHNEPALLKTYIIKLREMLATNECK